MEKYKVAIIFGGSVALILVAIIFSAVIDKTKQSSGSDTRARASKVGAMTLLATVRTFDPSTRELLVSDVKFSDTNAVMAGEWKVGVPSKFNESKFTAGVKVRIQTDPQNVDIAQHTLSAQEIERR